MDDAVNEKSDAAIINQVQLILAEKRTSLSAMRTGIAVFALPLSVSSVLIATHKYYDFVSVLHFLVPVIILCVLLVILGFYLVTRAIFKIHRYDDLIKRIKSRHSGLASLIDL